MKRILLIVVGLCIGVFFLNCILADQKIEIPGVSTDKLTFIFFHATGCWHSEEFEKVWDKYVEEKKWGGVNFLKLDYRGKSKEIFELIRKPLGQWSVPMIAFVKNDKMIYESVVAMDYRGQRMTDFVKATPENDAQIEIWDLQRFREFIQPILDSYQN